jgi:apolipoprotein D and lipocalin family protein
MSRTPTIGDAEYEDLRGRVAREGYDMEALSRVPQQWPESPAAPSRDAAKECS